MKVIGVGSDNNLICEISHQELEKFFNCYYEDSDPMRKSIRDLRAGSALNLGQGYDHLSEIRSAFKQMQDFIRANETVIKANDYCKRQNRRNSAPIFEDDGWW